MPLTAKGEEIMRSMKAQYGEKKGEQVFYASKNAGKISGVDGNEPYICPDCGEPSGEVCKHCGCEVVPNRKSRGLDELMSCLERMADEEGLEEIPEGGY